MKRVCLVYLCMFLATALIAQSDSGSIVNQQRRLSDRFLIFGDWFLPLGPRKCALGRIHLRDILPNLLA